jgi:hypothetical protein
MPTTTPPDLLINRNLSRLYHYTTQTHEYRLHVELRPEL